VAIAVTRVSSKGQVVIPKDIKSRLGIREGDRLLVYSLRDVIVLRKTGENEPLLEEVAKVFRDKAKKLGWTRRNVSSAIAHARVKQTR